MPWPTTAMFSLTGRPFTGYWERCDADEPPLLVLHGYGRGTIDQGVGVCVGVDGRLEKTCAGVASDYRL